jgi:hypothetical protein
VNETNGSCVDYTESFVAITTPFGYVGDEKLKENPLDLHTLRGKPA